MDRLTQIEERLANATPGPWEADAGEVSQHWSRPQPWLTVVGREVDCMSHCYGGSTKGIEREPDAALIAHAPTDLAALVAFARRVEAVLDDHVSTNEQVFDELDRAMRTMRGEDGPTAAAVQGLGS